MFFKGCSLETHSPFIRWPHVLKGRRLYGTCQFRFFEEISPSHGPIMIILGVAVLATGHPRAL